MYCPSFSPPLFFAQPPPLSPFYPPRQFNFPVVCAYMILCVYYLLFILKEISIEVSPNDK